MRSDVLPPKQVAYTCNIGWTADFQRHGIVLAGVIVFLICLLR